MEKDFDDAIRKLIEISINVYDIKYNKQDKTVLWFTRITKFNSAYIKSKKPKAFFSMFQKLYEIYKDQIDNKIFIETKEDTKVNDAWLKDKVNHENKNQTAYGWSPNQLTCSGVVLYVDPNIKQVSIPLSEIYLTIIDLIKKNKNDTKIVLLAPKFLQCIYKIFYAVTDHNSKLKENYETLTDLINKNSVDNSDDYIGNNMADFSKMISSLMKTAGINVSLDSKQIESAITTTFNNPSIKKMGEVVNKIVEDPNKLSENPGEAISQVINKIGDALRNEDVKSILVETVKETTDKTTKLFESIPTDKTNFKDFNPEEQE